MFLDDDFLLTTEMAKKLFHNHAKELPIVDYHCHLNPQEIYEDGNFTNLAQAWLGANHYGDHYKWRLMRANGVPERLITGDADDFDRFYAYAETIEKAVGNPMYIWTHLELKRFFGIHELLNRETARSIYDRANALLATPAFSARSLIRAMNVKIICTTDDPTDDLHFHKALQSETAFTVLPAFRPDKALNIDQAGFAAWIEKLATVSERKIAVFADVAAALRDRVEYFHTFGARLSDHALDIVVYQDASDAELDAILAKALAGETLSTSEIAQYRTAVLKALMRIYSDNGWTMQLHIHALRNINRRMFGELGPDTGYDGINDRNIAEPLAQLFDVMEAEDAVPKTIIYSLNPNDWLALSALLSSYQKDVVQKLQLGNAWWQNDTRNGMRHQLSTFAEQSLLANSVGMLTDSRSFLSYPRHEYFRRILCELIGEWVALGEVPNDEVQLGKIVEDISFNNANTTLGL